MGEGRGTTVSSKCYTVTTSVTAFSSRNQHQLDKKHRPHRRLLRDPMKTPAKALSWQGRIFSRGHSWYNRDPCHRQVLSRANLETAAAVQVKEKVENILEQKSRVSASFTRPLRQSADKHRKLKANLDEVVIFVQKLQGRP